MRLYLDCEFIEDGRTIDLISIALVSETGQEFYRQNSQADMRRASDWVQTNVLPRLWACPRSVPGPRHVYGLCTDPTCVWRPKRMIREELYLWVKEQCSAAFVGLDRPLVVQPEFWGYYADYDWVALCQLFGRMIDLPAGWPYYCRDIKQIEDYLFPDKRLAEIVPNPSEHNALSDARWNWAAHEWMISQEEVLQEVYARREAYQAGRVGEAASVLRGRVRPGKARRANADRHLEGGASGQGVVRREEAEETIETQEEVTDAGIR
jgi:3' exoribonuclease, RNase T-like